MPLEKLFDENFVAKNPKITANEEYMEEWNIETDKNLKMIKLLKKLSP